LDSTYDEVWSAKSGVRAGGVPFLEQPRELAERFLRKDCFDLLRVVRFAVTRDRDEGEAVSIGRNEAHRLGAQHEQAARFNF